MLLQRVRITNYKTYRELDLDLSVESERPIILIGGSNGGGKTTLFEAIKGALYGLKIKDKAHFDELLNDGIEKNRQSRIVLEVQFWGMVLNSMQKYILKRTYALNPQSKPVENVYLNMNGTELTYGSATPRAQRLTGETEVSKLIKANLPEELAKYFLFDAMQSSELLKKDVFQQTLRDNFENVLGFKKYLQMNAAAEHVQQEWAKKRLQAEQELKEYEQLCKQKENLVEKLKENAKEQDAAYKLTTSIEEEYRKAKDGVKQQESVKMRLTQVKERIDSLKKDADVYATDLKKFMEDFETSVILPQLVYNLAQELGAVLHAKEQAQKSKDDAIGLDRLRELTRTIVDYLKTLDLCTGPVDEERVANYVYAMQDNNTAYDPYDYLDADETEALKQLMKTEGANPFISLDQRRQNLELQIANLSDLTAEERSLQNALVGGNEQIIKQYENAQSDIVRLKEEKGELESQKSQLETKIHRYDIQVQQVPDLKYDTLAKLHPLFDSIADTLLQKKRELIEVEMKRELNNFLLAYRGEIARVQLADSMEEFDIKLFHTAGNEISLNQLNAASKQIFIQVFLKVLRNLGDYEPPVMIDTVMGVLDNESRDAMMEDYFPKLAEQTILLCTNTEIRTDSDYKKLEPFISKTYTLQRDTKQQCTTVGDGYFGITLNS